MEIKCESCVHKNVCLYKSIYESLTKKLMDCCDKNLMGEEKDVLSFNQVKCKEYHQINEPCCSDLLI